MSGGFTTSKSIESALRDDYRWLISCFDPKDRERHATKALRRQLRPWECAACRRTPPQVDLQAAHIAPLQECAVTTKKNLVPLCVQPQASPPACHSLFDNGCASMDEMEACRVAWASGTPVNLREPMVSVFDQCFHLPQQRGHLRKQVAVHRREQVSLQPTATQWHEIQLTIAEVVRRRARADALERARRELQRVDLERLSPRDKVRFLYERAYIGMLQGELEQAFQDFDAGRMTLRDTEILGNGWRWAAHTVLLAQVSRIMSSRGIGGGWSWDCVRHELMDALRITRADLDCLRRGNNLSESELRFELRHASRWVQNCLVHLVKPDVAQDLLPQACDRWEDASRNWRTMNVARGWDVGFRPTLLSLYGHITLGSARSDDDIRMSMGYLVRALVLWLGLKRQQPEGVRDALFRIAEGLRRLGEPTREERIRAVAEATVDYSSWFNPPTYGGSR